MGRPIFHVSTIGWHGAMQCAGGYEKRTYSRTSSIWLKRKVGRQKRTAKELGVLRPQNRLQRLKIKKNPHFKCNLALFNVYIATMAEEECTEDQESDLHNVSL